MPEHRKWADQLYATYARGREARQMVAIVGEGALAAADRRALAFAEEFERTFIGQGHRRRSIAETMAAGWRLLDRLPADDLLKLTAELLAGREQQRRDRGTTS